MSIRERLPRTLRVCHRRSTRPALETLEDRIALSSPSVHLNIQIHHPGGTSSGGTQSGSTGILHFIGGTTSPAGMTPDQLRKAYGIDQVKIGGITGDGTGQTIAIVDAYDAPNFVNSGSAGFSNSDLALFDQAFNLPDPPKFTKFNQTGGTTGLPPTDPSGAGNANGNWEMEISLDIEWAHAMAPGAAIDLVEANTDTNNNDLFTAVQTAAGLPGVSAVSMSWGLNEYSGESTVDSTFTTPSGHQGVTFLAATGDSGSPGYYPAYSPNVVAVGGTTLNLNADDSYAGELAWNGSGGGQSAFESQPNYQTGVQSTGQRTIPDVAFDADPNSGVSIYDSYDDTDHNGPWMVIGGTSLAAPAWAGVVAVTNQARVAQGGAALDGPSQTLPFLYALPSTDFHDITSGNNGGFKAGPGYDLVTGLGTPRADALVPDLAAYGTASQVVITAQPPANVIEGARFAVAVTAEDSLGHVDKAFTGSVSLALANNPTGANLGGTLTVNADQGVAVFDGLTMDKLGTGYTFTITPTIVPAVTTSAFNVTTDPTPWSGTFYPAPTDVSLRAAIAHAEGNGDAANSIVLATGTYVLTDAKAGQIVIQNTSTLANKTLTFVGEGQANSIIRPGIPTWNDRVFEILGASGAATNVVFQDLAIEGGNARNGGTLGGATALGGGLLIDNASVTLTDAAVANNQAAGLAGTPGTSGAGGAGGAGSDGGNAGDSKGGGIYLAGGTLTLNHAALSQNVAHGGVGGTGGVGGSGLNKVHPTQGKPGGTGGNGALGGAAAGGGVYVAGGQLVVMGGSFAGDQAVGGSGGNGGTGGLGGVNRIGGNGGKGGGAGPAAGGAIYLAEGAVTLTAASLQGNAAAGGKGGIGGLGGAGGSALEGGTGSLLGGSGFARPAASGGHHGTGADGGDGGLGGNGAEADAGGIFVAGGTLTLVNSVLDGNHATGGEGGPGGVGGPGAIGSYPNVTGTGGGTGGGVHGITGGLGGDGGNSGPGFGGGLYVTGGTVTLFDGTLSANAAGGGQGGAGGTGGPGALAGGLTGFGGGTATGPVPITGGPGGYGGDGQSGWGGGLYVVGGTITLTNMTLATDAAKAGLAGSAGAGGLGGTNGKGNGIPGAAGNPGDSTAGGLYVAGGSLVLDNTTVALNTDDDPSGTGVAGGVQAGGTVTAVSTLFAGNSTTDFSGNITANHSLFQTAPSSGTITGANNLSGVDPKLDPNGLQANGGPTLTIALLAGSPALGAGANPENLLADQRGFAPRTGPGGTDIGAYQRGGTADTTAPTVSLQAASITSSNAAAANPYTFTLTFTDDVAVAASTVPGAVVYVLAPGGGAPLPATAISTAAVGSTDAHGNAPAFVVTYQMTPPGGAWTQADNGTYTVSLGGTAVTDLAGNAAATGAVGTFSVQVIPDHLQITSQPPTTVTAGATFDVTFTVEDSKGNADPSFTGSVILMLGANPGNTSLGGTLSVTPVAGVADFPDLKLTIAAAGYTLQASAGGLASVTTSAITVIPAAASTLVVAGFPSPTTAGIAQTFTVTAKDLYGNTATSFAANVHFKSSDPKAMLPADESFTAADAGVDTFIATLETAGSQSITATDTAASTVNGTQSAITVAPAAASMLLVTGFPIATIAGVAHKLTVTAKDAFGNTATGYAGTIHFTTTDWEGALPADYPFTATDAGVRVFTVTLKAQGIRSVTATDTAAKPAVMGTEAGIHVSAAAFSSLHIPNYPTPTVAGTSHPFIVYATDAYSNTILNYTGVVHFGGTDHQATLPADYTFTLADRGLHVFPTATFFTAGYQLFAVTDKATGATTYRVTLVKPAAASRVVISGYPASAALGMSNAFYVTLYDAYGNVATGYTGMLHFTSDDPIAVLPPDYLFTTGDGGKHKFSATFKTRGTHWLKAADKAHSSLFGEQTGIVVN